MRTFFELAIRAGNAVTKAALLIFITETGSVAITPETVAVKEAKGDAKAPDWLHGLDLSCRRHDEKAFTKDTRKFGI